METKTPIAAASDPVSVAVRLGAFSNSELAAFSNEGTLDSLDDAVRVRAALDGKIAQLGAEAERRQAFRERGATSLAAHLAGGCGFSSASARVLADVGRRLFDLPHLQGALSAGELSLDQVRAIVEVADPESDADWVEVARGLSVSDLAHLAERRAAEAAERRAAEAAERMASEAAERGADEAAEDRAAPGQDAGETSSGRVGKSPARRSVRFNDACCTMTAQLPKEDYVFVRGAIDARVKDLGSNGETPLDERAGDALMTFLIDAQNPSERVVPSSPGRVAQRSSGIRFMSSSVVVAHVALEDLLDEGDGALALAELEGAGLVSAEVARRLACDAALVVALDDEAGHTMYEGRARRFPTDTQRRELWRRDRHCRFPGCSNDRFTRVHHVVPWKPDGRTDLDNLAILCEHHHHEVHSKRWRVSGDANVVLRFVGPGGREMTSRPSPLWGTGGTATAPRAGPGLETDGRPRRGGSVENRDARRPNQKGTGRGP
jgi:hypothetical protein